VCAGAGAWRRGDSFHGGAAVRAAGAVGRRAAVRRHPRTRTRTSHTSLLCCLGATASPRLASKGRLIDDPAYRLTPAGWLAGWLRASGSWLPCESRSPVLVGGEPSIRAICPSTVRAQIRPVSRKCEHHPAHAHVLSLAVSSTAHVCLRAAAEAVLAPAQTRGAHNSWVMSRPL
jgi:hypothetical protein